MVSSTLNAIKSVSTETSFYDSILTVLKDLDRSRGRRIIKFGLVYSRLAYLNKIQIRALLKSLERDGKITISAYNGVKINDNGEAEKK